MHPIAHCDYVSSNSYVSLHTSHLAIQAVVLKSQPMLLTFIGSIILSKTSLQSLIWRWFFWIYFSQKWQGLAHYSTQIPVPYLNEVILEWQHSYTGVIWEKNVKKLWSSSDSVNGVEYGDMKNKKCSIELALLRWQGGHVVGGNFS